MSEKDMPIDFDSMGFLCLVDSKGKCLFGRRDRYDHDMASASGGLDIDGLEGWLGGFVKFISCYPRDVQKNLMKYYSSLVDSFNEYKDAPSTEVSSDIRSNFSNIYNVIRDNLYLFQE